MPCGPSGVLPGTSLRAGPVLGRGVVVGGRLAELPPRVVVPGFGVVAELEPGRLVRRGSERRCSCGEIEASEDLARHLGILDGCDQAHAAAAAGAAQRIHLEDPLEKCGP